ncbi:hypothetical protein CUR21_10255 [Pseudorhodobacter sp. MZDSW-24AT]|nr:hypothetical protein CUR21_10255 [Pseudorhodobacter sp. MZDSW-24AT]
MLVGICALVWLQPWAPAVMEVAVETVAPEQVSRVLAVNGRVASEVSIEVRPLVSGPVLEVRVSEGDIVEVGHVLALIDPATQDAIVRQAVAGLDAALVGQTNAKSTYARTEALGTNAARVVLEDAARAVQTAAQEVSRLTALLDQAQIALTRFTIRA